MVDVTKLELSPPPQITFIDPNTREPAVGTIYFFKATDHNTPKLVYRDSGDPDNPFTPLTQVTLDAAGAWPYPIYLYPYADDGSQELYYVQGLRADSDCNDPSEFFAVDNWPNKYPPSGGGGGSDIREVYNFITDGIFSYPFNWTIPSDTQGQILENVTQIGQSWYFETDNVGKTSDKNNVFVTFTPLYLQNLAGNPVNSCGVRVTNFADQMAKLDVYQDLGPINLLQNESITLLLQGIDNLGGGSTTVITPILEFKYNETTITEQVLDPITLTGTEATHSITAVIQQLTTTTIDPDDNYLRIRFRFPLREIVNADITTLQIEKGIIANPAYIEVPTDLTKARTIANDWVEPQKTTDQKDLANYEPLYFKDGKYAFMGYAGQIFVPVFSTSCPPNLEICTGQSKKATDYSTTNIPYKKVYDVWGTTYGGGDGIIATSNGAVVTATSGQGGRQLTAWSATTDAHITVTLTQRGRDYGVGVNLKSGTTDTIEITWVDQFVAAAPPYYPGAPDPSLNRVGIPGSTALNTYLRVPSTNWENLGNFYEASVYNYELSGYPIFPQAPNLMTVTTVNIGSGSVNAKSEIKFNQGASKTYIPLAPNGSVQDFGTYNFSIQTGILEWATLDNNSRANACPNQQSWLGLNNVAGVVVSFSVDGDKGSILQGHKNAVVALASTDSIEVVINKFIKTIDNPFIYTLTVTATPAASSKLQCSTTTDNFYRWFVVDGVGTDPGGLGTGEAIDINSSDTLPEIATKIAASINIQEFNFPEQSDFPTGLDSTIKWAAFIA